jgi:hypothetical protein
MERPRGASDLALARRAHVVGVDLEPTVRPPPGGSESQAPRLPRVSASATLAPPWSKPNGCLVRPSTGMVPRM